MSIAEALTWPDGAYVNLSGVACYAKEVKEISGERNGEAYRFKTQGFLLQDPDDSGKAAIWVNWANPTRTIQDGDEITVESKDGKGARISTYEKDGETRRSVKVGGRWLSVVGGGPVATKAAPFDAPADVTERLVALAAELQTIAALLSVSKPQAKPEPEVNADATGTSFEDDDIPF